MYGTRLKTMTNNLNIPKNKYITTLKDSLGILKNLLCILYIQSREKMQKTNINNSNAMLMTVHHIKKALRAIIFIILLLSVLATEGTEFTEIILFFKYC
jgi:hypothetical protein